MVGRPHPIELRSRLLRSQQECLRGVLHGRGPHESDSDAVDDQTKNWPQPPEEVSVEVAVAFHVADDRVDGARHWSSRFIGAVMPRHCLDWNTLSSLGALWPRYPLSM